MLNRHISLVVLALLFMAASVQAADIAAGRRLHETHCTACHSSLMNGQPERIYTRSEHRIRGYPELLTQVRRCADSQGLQWSQSDLENVAAFLNTNYYRF